MQFANNVSVNAQASREMERFGGTEFWKNRYIVRGEVNTSRRFSVGGELNTGDQIRFVSGAFLGSSTEFSLDMTLRPFARLQSQITVDTSRLLDPRTNTQVFDVKIFRGLTTYQLTDRLSIRNITQYNTYERTLDGTYRVNAGTVFFVGYDDHYREGDRLNAQIFPYGVWQRTNRAIFTKLQYLFRR